MIGFLQRRSSAEPMIFLAAGLLLVMAAVPPSVAMARTGIRIATALSVHSRSGDGVTTPLQLRSVAGAPIPVYVTESIPQEQVDWTLEALQIAWPEVRAITGLTPPPVQPPVYMVRDQQEVSILCRCSEEFPACWTVYEGDRYIACNAQSLVSRGITIRSLSHELTHQFGQGDLGRTRGVAQWYDEGLAEYVQSTIVSGHAPAYAEFEWRSREAVVANALREGSYLYLEIFPTNQRWQDWGHAHGQKLQYAEAALAMRALVARYGMPTVADVVRRTDPQHPFDAVFAETLGQSVADFDAALEAQLRAELLGPGRVLYHDDFSDPESGWPRVSPDPTRVRVGYVDGEYQVAIGDRDWVNVQRELIYTDFLAEVDARLVDAPELGYPDLRFRVQPDKSHYVYLVNPQAGSVALFYSPGDDGELTPLVPWTAAPSARLGEANRLGVRAEGDHITLLLNGAEVAQVEDATLPAGGLGLGVLPRSDGGAEARFGNLVVTTVN
jgi:hypothetical protein